MHFFLEKNMYMYVYVCMCTYVCVDINFVPLIFVNFHTHLVMAIVA